MQVLRILKHLLHGRLQVLRRFPPPTMAAIKETIRQSEANHMGELRFAVEAALDWRDLLRGVTPRERAIEIFSRLRVWDTEHNSGVLIYLLLADHRVEIVADRGIHARVGEQGWQAICSEMEQAFHVGDFERGAITGINRIGALLTQYFPVQGANPDELSNDTAVL